MDRMPVGIKDPSDRWGALDPIRDVAPTPPVDWANGEVEGFYYVDPNASNGTNDPDALGHPGQPRLTIPDSVEAGAYVELHGDFGGGREQINGWQGTEENPIWLKGEGHTSSGRLTFTDAEYLFVDGIEMSGGTGGGLGINGSSHHVVVRNSTIMDQEQPTNNDGGFGRSSGISIIPDRGGDISDIVVYNNKIKNLGEVNTTADTDYHGIAISLYNREDGETLKHVTVLNNEVSAVSGDGVQLVSTDNTPAVTYENMSDIHVGGNHMFGNRQSGVGVKEASNVIISENLIHDMLESDAGNLGAGIGIGYRNDNIWVLNNHIYDSVFGIRQGNEDSDVDGKVYILNNLIHDIFPPEGVTYNPANAWNVGTGIAFQHGDSDRVAVNNTLHNVHDGVNAAAGGGETTGPGTDTVDLQGNIISQKDDTFANNRFLDIHEPARGGNFTAQDNYFIDVDAGTSPSNFKAKFAGASTQNTTTVEGFESESNGTAQNNELEIGDSSTLFVDAEGGNFNLVDGSGAIGLTTRHEAYDIFEALYELDIYVDFNGNPRNADATAAGAFEFGSTPPPPPPSEPGVTPVVPTLGELDDYGVEQTTKGEDAEAGVPTPGRIELDGNIWKSYDVEFTVTEDSYLEFDLQVSNRGEIHGIGLDTDGNPTTGTPIVNLFGTDQTFGQDGPDYTADGGVQSFRIKLSDYYEVGATYTQLVFVNDNDAENRADYVGDPAQSSFDNIRFVEDSASTMTFDAADFTSYSRNQDSGTVATVDGGNELQVLGNAWKAVDFDYTVTSNTVIEFDYRSTEKGELQGFTLETDNDFTTGAKVVQLYGRHSNGRFDKDIATYNGSGDWQSFTIDASDITLGDISSLAFVNDDDAAPSDGNSFYRNFKIYEADAPEYNIITVSSPELPDTLDLTNYPLFRYFEQDKNADNVSFTVDADSIALSGNTWKNLKFDYDVTENTFVEFTVSGTDFGEIAGIGFDNGDGQLSADEVVQVGGTQTDWADLVLARGNPAGEQTYRVALSDVTDQDIEYIGFVADDDANASTSITFSDVRFYEGFDTAFTATDAADKFVVENNVPTTIKPFALIDFDTSEDIVDVSGLIKGTATQPKSDYVEVTVNAGFTSIAVDADGLGGDYVEVARVNGVTDPNALDWINVA